jgi:hypothetical protein
MEPEQQDVFRKPCFPDDCPQKIRNVFLPLPLFAQDDQQRVRVPFRNLPECTDQMSLPLLFRQPAHIAENEAGIPDAFRCRPV